MFKGSFTALVTPFKSGEIDIAAFESLIEWQISSGTHGLVPCGTTGETPTLSNDDYKLIIERCVTKTAGRVPVIAGTGSNSTQVTIEKTLYAQKAGADGALIVVPYYNKPTQEGLYQHYKAVHDATDIPIVLYNVPGRTGVNLEVGTVCRLAELDRIVAIKDAVQDLSRVLTLRTRLGNDFSLLSGEDATIAGFLAQGGNGSISVTANVAPDIYAKVYNAWQRQDIEAFKVARNSLINLSQALFAETNPAPVKYCLAAMGMCENELRLPLVPVTKATETLLDGVLKDLGILSSAKERVRG